MCKRCFQDMLHTWYDARVLGSSNLSQTKSSNSDRAIRASVWKNWLCAADVCKSCPKQTGSPVIGSINNTLTVGESLFEFRVWVSVPNRIRSSSNRWWWNKYFNILSLVVFGRKCLTREAAVRMISLWQASGPWVQCTPNDPAVIIIIIITGHD